MQRNQSIDLIKIIAMYMVLMLHTGVARHFATNYDYTSVPEVYMVAGIAIPLFFMVSGFLLANRLVDWKYSFSKIIGILRFTFIICLPFDIRNLLINIGGVISDIVLFKREYSAYSGISER